eukprot:COSAG02_NODE_17797_length_980_cov_1.322361_1_plen_114_part_10
MLPLAFPSIYELDICARCARLVTPRACGQSLLRFVELLAGKPAPFAISYSLGNLLSLAGCEQRADVCPLRVSQSHPLRCCCSAYIRRRTSFIIGEKARSHATLRYLARGWPLAQ